MVEETAREAAALLEGARIEKIRQLDPAAFVFALHGSGRDISLLVSVGKGSRAFHLLFRKIHGDYLFTAGPSDILRKHLLRGVVVGLEAGVGIVELSIRRGEEYKLAFHFGRPDVRLSRGDGETVFALSGAARPDAQPPETAPPGTVMPDAGGRAAGPGTRGGSTLPDLPLNEWASRDFFASRGARLSGVLKKKIRKEEAKVRRLVGKLEAERAETEDKDETLLKGELLKTGLSRVRKGATSVLLEDRTGGERLVELDPKLGPLENMNAYFKRYKKLKSRERYIDGNLDLQRVRLDALDSFERALEAEGLPDLASPPSAVSALLDTGKVGKAFAEDVASFGAPARGARAGGRKEGGEKRGRTEEGYLRFRARSGKTIVVGRSARENDQLSTRYARGNDLWFHALGGTGSHVILRYDSKAGFLDTDVADAALLALYFSGLRKRGEGEVVFTYCKNLRKPRGAKEGTVVYHHNKTRLVRLDEKLLEALKRG